MSRSQIKPPLTQASYIIRYYLMLSLSNIHKQKGLLRTANCLKGRRVNGYFDFTFDQISLPFERQVFSSWSQYLYSTTQSAAMQGLSDPNSSRLHCDKRIKGPLFYPVCCRSAVFWPGACSCTSPQSITYYQFADHNGSIRPPPFDSSSFVRFSSGYDGHPQTGCRQNAQHAEPAGKYPI